MSLDERNLISAFENFLRIDRQLSDLSVKGHLMTVKRFLRAVEVPVKAITSNVIRGYLMRYSDMSPNTYANQLKSLKVFFRDFLGVPQVVKSFRFPAKSEEPIIVPSKEQVQAFYYALETPIARALFLIYATSGLRKREVLSLLIEDVDFGRRMIVPRKPQSRTKRKWITFFNEEALQALKEYLATRNDDSPKLFRIGTHPFLDLWKNAYRKTGIYITPQVLREWFCNEMGKLGVPDRYVDAFCGRIPKSVLARRYSDYSPENLKQIYDKAGLRVLS